MKKHLFSILTALCLCLSMLPTAAFAEGSTEEPPVCICETACTAESMNAECSVCGAEGALTENCIEYIKSADGTMTQPKGESVTLNSEGENAPVNAAEKEVGTAEDLAAAIADTTVTTVKLAANIDFSGTLTVTRTVTLDLNGFTLKFTNPNQISITTYGRNNSYTESFPIGILVKSQADQRGRLTLADSSKAATGRLEMTGVNDNAIFVTDGELTMTGGTITNSYSGEIGFLKMTGIGILRGKASMTGGRIEKQKQMGVWVCASTFTMGGNAVISGCGTAADMTSSVGGGVLVNDNYVPYWQGSTARTIIPSYFTLEGGARIENCAAKYGGGVSVGDNCLFTMTGGSITGCTAYMEGGGVVTEGYGPGSTSEDIKPVFIMSGGSISDCKAGDTHGGTGGGVSVGGRIAGATGFSMFEMTGGTIIRCKAAVGGGVNIQGSSSFTMTNGSITDCESLLGGGVVLRQASDVIAPTMFTMTDGSITGCKAVYNEDDSNSARGGGVYMGSGCQLAMNGNACITGCEAARSGSGIYGTNDASYPWQVPLFTRSDNAQVDKGVSMDYALQVGSEITDFQTVRMDGLGTEAYPYEIGTADHLKLFRQIVNGAQTDNQNAVLPPQNVAACAVLTGSIDLNNEKWTPIGNDSNKYTGTFNGQNYTINGLNIDDADQRYVGLFGYISGATVKNLTAAGTVKGSKSIGGIVGGAVKNSTIENCRNDCRVTSNADNDGSPSAAGIVSWASNTIIAGCINTGMIEANGGYTGEAGGIVSTLSASVTIRNCCNTGEVKVSGNSDVGLYDAGGIVGASNAGTVVGCYNAGIVTVDCSGEATYFSYVGGIVGFAGHYGEGEAVYDCFNVGAVKAQGKVYVGGVVGRNSAAKVYNCYNAGTMTGPSIGGVVGSNSNAVENCYYLDSTAEKAIAENDAKYGTVDETTGPKTAVELGSGTVLALLINGRDDSEHPWNSECKYLAAAGKTLPVFNWQNGDEHTHTWSQWTHVDGTDTHSRSCTCNAVETENCFGGEATCTAKAKCVTCSAEYGDIDHTRHGDKLTHVDAKAATTSEDGNIEYWYCEACNKYFSDAAATKVITQADTVIPKRQSSGGSSSSSYPVTAPAKTENGSVTVSPKNASKGSTVTITVTPDSGYVLETISVTDKNGNDLKLTDKGNGKYTFTMPGSKVEVKVTFMEDNSVLNFFYDVPNDAYYYEAVKWAAENGITGGVGNSLFAPNQPCTRAQIVTFLWRAAGSPVVNYLMPFTDVDEGAYYAEAARWAASTGIVTGLTETTFGTDSVCTRAQAAAMIYRCAQAQGKGFTGAWMFHLPFTDVPEWAYESVAWCYMNGVTTGVSETSFAPGNDCTRAQIVTFLWRAFSK